MSDIASVDRRSRDRPEDYRREDRREDRRGNDRDRSYRDRDDYRGGDRRRDRSPPPRDRDRDRDYRRRDDYRGSRRSYDHRGDDDRRRDDRRRDDRRRSRSRSPMHDRRMRARSPSVGPDVVPLSQWPRKLNNWDFKPPGYEHMTAQMAKMSGLFPLPSHTMRTAAVFLNPNDRPDAFGDRAEGVGAGGPAGANASRQQRRVYVGNIPGNIEERVIVDFMNALLRETGIARHEGNSVMDVHVNHDRHFAFVEFRDPQEATDAIHKLDGVTLQGMPLRFRRPKDYIDPETNAQGDESPNKLFIGNLPPSLGEAEVREILETFGPLRYFKLIRDNVGASKGFGFAEYEDSSITDVVCEGLNDMQVGERNIVVQRSNSSGGRGGAGGAGGASGEPNTGLAIPSSLVDALTNTPLLATPVVQLLNLVTEEELKDDEDYQDLLADVQEECQRFGQVQSVVIPRPVEGQLVAGLTRVFVKFNAVEEAISAYNALGGRKFADRIVVTGYFPVEQLDSGDFSTVVPGPAVVSASA